MGSEMGRRRLDVYRFKDSTVSAVFCEDTKNSLIVMADRIDTNAIPVYYIHVREIKPLSKIIFKFHPLDCRANSCKFREL